MLKIHESKFKTDIFPKVSRFLNKNKRSTGVGQEFFSFLKETHETNPTKYWEYINLDLLLNLQRPKTSEADEKVFIIYHQICELIFKLIINEIEQLLDEKFENLDLSNDRVKRLNHFYQYLIYTFPILINCMARESFHIFRKALYPASGQQSVQFRVIEIMSTDLLNLIHKKFRSSTTAIETVEDLYKKLYWQSVGHKSDTLDQFNDKYYDGLIALSHEHRVNNLSYYITENLCYIRDHEIFESLRQFDLNVNVNWPMEHYKCVSHNLIKEDRNNTTGGTDWQKYLHPKHRKNIFFPILWTKEEVERWGAKVT